MVRDLAALAIARLTIVLGAELLAGATNTIHATAISPDARTEQATVIATTLAVH